MTCAHYNARCNKVLFTARRLRRRKAVVLFYLALFGFLPLSALKGGALNKLYGGIFVFHGPSPLPSPREGRGQANRRTESH